MNTAVCCMYDDLEALNVDVVDVKLKNNFAIAFFDNFLVIDRSKCKTAAQERTVLAHEAGHYMSGAFYRAYSPFEVKEQAEHRAFAASVEKYLPVNEILNCYKMGMTENWEIAEYFNLEEEFVEKAVHYWTDCKGIDCNGVQREHNKKLNNGLPILHKVPPKRDYGRYFCIMAEKGETSHGGLTEKLSLFFHAKKQEVNAYGR